jgi:hypothetical protein
MLLLHRITSIKKKPPKGYRNPLEALYSISSGKIFSQFYPEV